MATLRSVTAVSRIRLRVGGLLQRFLFITEPQQPSLCQWKRKTLTMDAGTEKLKLDAREIFAAAVDAVLPHWMVSEALHCHGNSLTVNGQQYKVDHNVYVVGFGKAVIGMVRAVDSILGGHVQRGVASVPYGIRETLRNAGKSDLLPSPQSKVEIMEGAKNNLPDVDSQRAADRIIELTERLGEGDLLIVLVSGGGSALLPAPIPPLALQDIYDVSKILSKKGCTIKELNTIRKHLSRLKGGGLAKLAHPAQVISLILSDIIGNRLDMIASGPTIPDDSTPQDCLDIISHLNATDLIPVAVLSFLREAVGVDAASKKTGSLSCDHVLNVCIGHNTMAAEAAKMHAEVLGFSTVLLSTELFGEAKKLGQMFTDLAAYIYNLFKSRTALNENESVSMLSDNLMNIHGLHEKNLEEIQTAVSSAMESRNSVCVISAGEATVNVTGTGKGGRNQETSLAVAIMMNSQSVFRRLMDEGYHLAFLSGGTDGQDGPTDATGALADPHQVTLANHLGLNASVFLQNNDSYSFYSHLNSGKDLLRTGLTGTNVMDIHILVLTPPL